MSDKEVVGRIEQLSPYPPDTEEILNGSKFQAKAGVLVTQGKNLGGWPTAKVAPTPTPSPAAEAALTEYERLHDTYIGSGQLHSQVLAFLRARLAALEAAVRREVWQSAYELADYELCRRDCAGGIEIRSRIYGAAARDGVGLSGPISDVEKTND